MSRLNIVIALSLITAGIFASPYESRLIDDLLSGYQLYALPATSNDNPVVVEYQVTLRSIDNVDETRHTITTSLWIDYRWHDYRLVWNPSSYGNITELRLPNHRIWKPDIELYNKVGFLSGVAADVNTVVYYDGTVSHTPPASLTSSCQMNTKWFPFDKQQCKLTFGSWTNDGRRIDLRIKDGSNKGSLDGYSASSEWDLLDFAAVRNVVLYECCPDYPYIDITFTLSMERKSLYYVVNIIGPCIILAVLTLLTFTIPPESGEKLTFGVVTLLMLGGISSMMKISIPPSSISVPFIGVYLGFVVIINILSLTSAILVLNCHHKNSPMPKLLKDIFCNGLAKVLLLKTDQSGKKSALTNGWMDSNSASLMGDNSMSKADDAQHNKSELQPIMGELHAIRRQVEMQEECELNARDWKLVGAVMDRMLFVMFAIAMLVGSFVLLLKRPM